MYIKVYKIGATNIRYDQRQIDKSRFALLLCDEPKHLLFFFVLKKKNVLPFNSMKNGPHTNQ
jgi:hypothetical protein